jgi:hypothetical protein
MKNRLFTGSIYIGLFSVSFLAGTLSFGQDMAKRVPVFPVPMYPPCLSSLQPGTICMSQEGKLSKVISSRLENKSAELVLKPLSEKQLKELQPLNGGFGMGGPIGMNGPGIGMGGPVGMGIGMGMGGPIGYGFPSCSADLPVGARCLNNDNQLAVVKESSLRKQSVFTSKQAKLVEFDPLPKSEQQEFKKFQEESHKIQQEMMRPSEMGGCSRSGPMVIICGDGVYRRVAGGVMDEASPARKKVKVKNIVPEPADSHSVPQQQGVPVEKAN